MTEQTPDPEETQEPSARPDVAVTVYDARSSKVGRPTDYTEEFCQIAANLCAAGATDFEVAERLGVSARTIYRWKAEYPEFRQALVIGKEAADERVETSLYHRAVGYSFEAVKIMQDKGFPVVVRYTEHVAPDPGAAFNWLKNRKPMEWRDRKEVTGVDGAPLVVTLSFVPGAGA